MTHALSKTWSEYSKECEQQTDEELAGRMENYGLSESKARIARIVYETRQINRQHHLNKENIELQHSLNAPIVEKQLKLMKITTFVTAASTVIAALAGAYLAYALTQTQKPLQIRLDSSQLSQIQTVLSSAASHSEKRR